MIAIFLGAPGVGKGTQAAAAAESQGWTHLSTGDLLRQEVAAGTDLGLKAKEYMDRGDLVPDNVMVGMVAARVESMENNEVLLLDGFPRTKAQAEALHAAAPEGSIRLAVCYTASDETLISRLLGRGRTDDTREVVEHRLAVYSETTEPLVAFYRDLGILCEVDAEREIKIIQSETIEIIRTGLASTNPQGANG
ncbi:MAG: adenylate kinase [Planctomycetota bacterium]|jgi:adenylate kinase|nr:adenylate kinase [Planctomycetota bacterium]MDP6941819.1 adenylate kinase [Planctomycetota bacterium]